MTRTHPSTDFATLIERVFDRVAGEAAPDCPAALLAAMIEAGLISQTTVVVGHDSLGPVLQKRFRIPQPYSGQWQAFKEAAAAKCCNL
jgi:RecB family exonuclease